MGLILISSLTLHQPPRGRDVDLISDIRAWAFEQNLWPALSPGQGHASLIAVREIYKVEQVQLSLRAYLLVPCKNLCGVEERCARHCQHLIQEWAGSAVDARMIIEGYDHKNQRSLGRVILKTIAPVTLRYWSRQQKLIALTQTVNAHDHRLHLLQLVAPDQVDHLQEFNRAEQALTSKTSSRDPQSKARGQQISESTMTLRYYDTLDLGSFTGRSDAVEGATKFVDLDGDRRIELVAPLKSLVHLTPFPLAVPTPYRLTPQGLHVDTQLISATSPKISELRTWILSRRPQESRSETSKAQTSPRASQRSSQELLAATMRRAKEVYIYAAQLCLKSQCDAAERLVQFAYPQHEVVQRIWKQLRTYIAKSTKVKAWVSVTPPDHPFSALDQSATSQGISSTKSP